MPKISIIVPVYNSAETINRCINSLCNQQNGSDSWGGYLFDYEVVVIDDGSTDNSPSILNELSKRFSQLKVLHKNNGGAAAARKYGIENSKSDYIAFCDADDYVDSDWLLTMYEYMIDYNADISMIQAYLNDRNISKIINKPYTVWEWNQDQSYRKFLEHIHLNGVLWTKLFRRDLFDNLDWGTSMKIYEDGYIFWQIIGKIQKIVKVLIPKYHYMFNNQSLTNSEYDMGKYNSYRMLLGRILSDCSNGKLRIYRNEAITMNCIWTYNHLCYMLASSFQNKDVENDLVSILRNNTRTTIGHLKGSRNKLTAIIMMLNPTIVRILYRLLRK